MIRVTRGPAAGRRPRPAAPCRSRAVPTVPAWCAVIEASIFIASMVATVWPASTCVALADLQRDDAGERRRHVLRVRPVGLLRGLDVAGDRLVAHRHRPHLAVQRGEHVAEAALVRLGDRLQLDEQRDARLQLRRCARCRARGRRGSPSSTAPTCRRRPRGGPGTPWSGRGTAAGSAWRGGCRAARRGPRRTARAPRVSAGRPSSARVRNGSGQPPGGSPSSPRRNPITESGTSNWPGSASKSFGSTPAPTRCSARSPTTFDDGVTFTSRPSIRSAAA